MFSLLFGTKRGSLLAFQLSRATAPRGLLAGAALADRQWSHDRNWSEVLARDAELGHQSV